jgi:hypothetical protein
LSDLTDNGNRSKIFFGGYDRDFIRSFNGFAGYTDKQIESSINWIPLIANATQWEIALARVSLISNSNEKVIYNN